MGVILLENLILFDWFTVTIHGFPLADVFDWLGISSTKFLPMQHGRFGYRSGLTFEHISIYYDGNDDQGICLDMSGSGCRTFETFGSGDWFRFLKFFADDPDSFHITRLDVAFDDHSGLLDLDEMRDDIDDLNFVSKSKSYEVCYGSAGTTFYFGSMYSNFRLRIYDKAAERGFLDRHWVRVEMQLRRENALNFILKLDEDIGNVFFGVLSNYLRFCVPSVDSNKSRWPTVSYWENFLQGVLRITLWSNPGLDYNLSNLENFVIGQAGNAIDTYIDIFGIDGLLESLDNRYKRISPKYEKLKSDYNLLLKESLKC